MVFVIHWYESAMDIHVFPIPIPPPPSLSTWSLWVFPVHQVWALVSCIRPGLVICFTLDNILVSMLFSQNIPPSPSPTEFKSLFHTSVPLFLFCNKFYFLKPSDLVLINRNDKFQPWSSLVAQMVKNQPAVQETWVQSLGWEDPLEEGMATHSSILAWKTPWTEEPGGLWYMGSQRVRHDWATKHTSFNLTEISSTHLSQSTLTRVPCLLMWRLTLEDIRYTKVCQLDTAKCGSKCTFLVLINAAFTVRDTYFSVFYSFLCSFAFIYSFF